MHHLGDTSTLRMIILKMNRRKIYALMKLNHFEGKIDHACY